jgi:hypothetical protein
MSENDTTLNFSENNQDKVNEIVSNKTEINTENITIFEKKEESKEEDTKKEDSSKDSDEKEEKSDNDEKKKEEYSCNQDDDIKKKYELELENAERKYSVLDKEYNELKNNYTKLEQECYALREYKNEIENKQKDELIDKFYMLSEEDKKDVIENKSKYTLAEIESKLATIGFRNGVNFNLDASANKQEVITTFNLQSVDAADAAPDFIKAIRQTRNRNN